MICSFLILIPYSSFPLELDKTEEQKCDFVGATQWKEKSNETTVILLQALPLSQITKFTGYLERNSNQFRSHNSPTLHSYGSVGRLANVCALA